MLAPGPDERVFDGSCGTGTFLATTAVYMFERFLAEAGTTPETATRDELRVAQARTAAWATGHVFGCDMNPALVVAARLNVLLTAGQPGNIYRIDARTFPDGALDDQERASAAAPLGSMDIVVTNPWFSTRETIDDEAILDRYDLGHVWMRNEDGHFVNTGAVKAGGVPPEVLFLERAWHWAKPGTGRIAILLPDGLLGNPGDEYVRWWILRHCEVLASADLPVEPFMASAWKIFRSGAAPLGHASFVTGSSLSLTSFTACSSALMSASVLFPITSAIHPSIFCPRLTKNSANWSISNVCMSIP